MSNPIYGLFNKGNMPMGNFQNMMNQFNQFRSMFKGNAEEQVKQLLNSGKMTPQQFNQLKQVAEQIQGMMK